MMFDTIYHTLFNWCFFVCRMTHDNMLKYQLNVRKSRTASTTYVRFTHALDTAACCTRHFGRTSSSRHSRAWQRRSRAGMHAESSRDMIRDTRVHNVAVANRPRRARRIEETALRPAWRRKRLAHDHRSRSA